MATNIFIHNITNVFNQLFPGGGDDDDDNDRRNSRHMEEDPIAKKERNKVIDTEDCSRGPLSGCIRLADSSRVIQRLKVREALQFRYKYLQIYRPTYLHLELV